MRYSNKLAAAAAVAASAASALTVTPSGDATTLANAILGPGITLVSATFQGDPAGSGTYTDGPLGIRDSAILTSGDATHPYAPSSVGTTQNQPGFAKCEALAGGSSFDAAVLTMEVVLQPGFQGFFSQFVFASDEYPEFVGSDFNDVFGIWVDGTQIAFDGSNAPITINGPFFSSANVLTPPQSGNYGGSTPLLQSGFSTTPGAHTVEIAVCDIADYVRDSAVFVTLAGCTDEADCKGGTVLVPTTTLPGATTTAEETSSMPAETSMPAATNTYVPSGSPVPYGNMTTGAPYGMTTEAPVTLTKCETHTYTITSCPASHPCHPVTYESTVTYHLTKSVTVPCVTSTMVENGVTKYTTMTLEAITTYVTCPASIYSSRYNTPVAAPSAYATPVAVPYVTSMCPGCPVVTATKSLYAPANAANTSYPAAFTGGAAAAQGSSSFLIAGLVGLLALVPVMML